jgi:hypothetical protein
MSSNQRQNLLERSLCARPCGRLTIVDLDFHRPDQHLHDSTDVMIGAVRGILRTAILEVANSSIQKTAVIRMRETAPTHESETTTSRGLWPGQSGHAARGWSES